MSFFGFDTTIPNEKPSGGQARGIFETSDPFAQRGSFDDDEILDFEDTYDGLGDQLDDADDTFNEDTFGGGGDEPVGKDFDFYGKTAQVVDVIDEEHELYNLKHGFKKPMTATLSSQESKPAITDSGAGAGKTATTKPKRTGYEPYQDPDYIPELHAKSSVWGLTSKKKEEPSQPAKKMMSLEEVEAQMRMQTGAQAKPSSLEEIEAQLHAQARLQQHQLPSAAPAPAPAPAPALMSQQPHPPLLPPNHLGSTQPPLPPLNIPPQQMIPLLQSLQHIPALAEYIRENGILPQALAAAIGLPADLSQLEQAQMAQLLRGSSVTSHAAPGSHNQPRPPLPHPEMANPAATGNMPPGLVRPPPPGPGPVPGMFPPTGPGQFLPGMPPPQHPASFRQAHPKPPMMNLGFGAPVTMPPSSANLTEEQREEILREEAKRAKRNHKIFLLSKGNGLMTPQDKNFITRIQLQQLVAANGGTENDLEAMLAEDFYYQVYSQIRAPRSHPRQPLGHFAQTYLFQTGGRAGNRRQYGGGDNHMQRMQQQVQRAVEAAKARPRNKQLIIEGSLGKISFSNSRTPKTMLNIKRDNQHGKEGTAKSPRPKDTTLNISDRKSILRNIETVYDILMQMEDLQRKMPPAPASEEEAAGFDAKAHMSARAQMTAHNRKLWDALQILEPIVPGSTSTHPFIAFLNHSKGKKAIPRIWRHIDQEQRVTVLTMIAINLDSLDVVDKGQPHSGETQPVTSVREEIEMFQRVVMPSLISYTHDAPLSIIAGLLGLILARTHVESVVMSRIGLLIFCMLLSRAETVRASTQVAETEWAQWMELYNSLFDRLEHAWDAIFPESVNSGDDMYAWQFLAAVGVGANPEQQQRLVIAVKDRVMETVQQSKTLPLDMGAKRLANVNLFMRSIGLDVDLL
ncbi:hypothetical protein KEM54_000923 [Ascosphaera aggregata]|nr:hypothetical protein KEM54_000923 [Ascosphaera aggregata]